MGLQPARGGASAVEIGRSGLDGLMRRGAILDCKWESVNPEARRACRTRSAVEHSRASRAVFDSEASACAGLTMFSIEVGTQQRVPESDHPSHWTLLP